MIFSNAKAPVTVLQVTSARHSRFPLIVIVVPIINGINPRCVLEEI